MIGRQIHHYRIVAKLGEGGMGSVWKAEDTVLERPVALKLPAPHLVASEEARELFLREARAASKLEHPGLVAVYEAGYANGQSYIAYKYIEGETLEQEVGAAGLSLARAVGIAARVAEALAHAHERRVLHRDVSSNNILVTPDGRPVLVDFGLARGAADPHLTRTGTTMGTFHYLAPEVLTGDRGDERADLYGLGVVLYRMVTGRVPFEGASADAISYLAVNVTPARPAALRPEIPGALDGLIMRLLEKAPQQRYQTAAELALELETLGRSGALEAADESGPGRAGWLRRGRSAWLRARAALRVRLWPLLRRRRAAAAASVMALAAVAALVDYLGGPGRSIAVLPLRNLSDDPQETGFLVEGFGELLSTRLAELDGLQVLPWLTTRRTDPSKPLPTIARALRAGTLVTGSYRTDGDQLHVSISVIDGRKGHLRWGREFDRPLEDLIAVQSEIAASVAERLRPGLTGKQRERLTLPAARSGEAYELYLRGSELIRTGDPEVFSRGEQFLERALELDPSLADAHVGLGATHAARYFNRLEGGDRNIETAQLHYAKALEIDPGLVSAMRGLARLNLYRSEAEANLKLAQRAARLEPQTIETRLLQAEAYVFAGMADWAVPLLERVLELDPANEAALWDLVVSAVLADQYRKGFDEGASYLRRFGEDSEVYIWMASAAEELGSPDSTIAALLERAITIDEPRHIHRAIGPAASFYLATGREDRANLLLSRETAALEQQLAAYPSSVSIRCVLAANYALLRRREDAREQVNILMPLLARPGYRDYFLPILGNMLLYAGEDRLAVQIYDLMRRSELAGYARDRRLLRSSRLPEIVNHPEYRRILAESEAQLAGLRAKYRPTTR